MKVLMINGSPNPEGCTWTALREVEDALKSHGMETEIVQIGRKPISGCIACGKCKSPEHGDRCALPGDLVNDTLEKALSADGFIIGSPVYFASANGSLTSFLDRLFFAGSDRHFAFKPGAALVSARRAGTTASLDQLNKYFTIKRMPVVSSQYWNMVHGYTPEDVRQDLEGMQIMRTLGHNMAWLLQCIEAGKKAGIPAPVIEAAQRTNFIR